MKKHKLDPNFYDQKYYLSDEYAGSEYYRNDLKKMAPHLVRIYRKIEPTSERLKFLDAGCGKGELLYFMAKKGYQVYGIDYSKTAVKMSQELLEIKKIKGKVIKTDVRDTTFPSNYFDIIVSADVIEHLDDNHAAIKFFSEMYRILKPDGRFYLHTAPNRLRLDCFSRYYQRYLNFIVFSLLNLFKKEGKKYKVTLEIRTPTDKLVHQNEQTYFSLRDNFNKSLFEKYQIEIAPDPLEFSFWKLPYYLIGYLWPINKVFPLSIFLGNHLYAVASKETKNGSN